MPLTTKAEVKKLLQIPTSDTSKDDAIDSLILKVQTFFIKRINNCVVPNFYKEGYNISFDSSDRSINDSDSGLVDAGFAVNNEILIQGSFQNDKVFKIESITEGKIVVVTDANAAITTEESGNRIIIHRVEFSGEIEMAAIDFIAERLNKSRNISSHSLGDHSETFISQKEMLNAFSSWKKVQWV